MFVYRIAHPRYSGDLSGEGARLYGGRWNPKGLACLYTSDHPALALLELAVHHTAQNLPESMVLMEIEVPNPMLFNFVDEADLNPNWKTSNGQLETETIGTNWLLDKEKPMLKVPSVLCPFAWNWLINPDLVSSNQLKIVSVIDIIMDGRIKA